MTKSSHSGHAARMGVECGVLAKMGWTASPDVFGPKGFFDTFFQGDARAGAAHRRLRRAAAHGRSRRRLQETSEQLLHAPADRRGARTARTSTRIEPDRDRARRGRSSRVSITSTGRSRRAVSTASSACSTRRSLRCSTAKSRSTRSPMSAASRRTSRRCCRSVKLTVDDAIPRDFDQMHIDRRRSAQGWPAASRSASTNYRGWVGSPLTREQRLKKFFGCARAQACETRRRSACSSSWNALDSLPTSRKSWTSRAAIASSIKRGRSTRRAASRTIVAINLENGTSITWHQPGKWLVNPAYWDDESLAARAPHAEAHPIHRLHAERRRRLRRPSVELEYAARLDRAARRDRCRRNHACRATRHSARNATWSKRAAAWAYARARRQRSGRASRRSRATGKRDRPPHRSWR